MLLSILPVSVSKRSFCGEPLPCKTAARTSIQPLIWCFPGRFSQGSSSPGECFFSQAQAAVINYVICYNNIYIYIYIYNIHNIQMSINSK